MVIHEERGRSRSQVRVGYEGAIVLASTIATGKVLSDKANILNDEFRVWPIEEDALTRAID